MIEFVITFAAVAESKTWLDPHHGYELPRHSMVELAPATPPQSKSWLLPKPRFDDSQDCLTFLERQIEGFGLLRITHRCPEGTGEIAPWRSL